MTQCQQSSCTLLVNGQLSHGDPRKIPLSCIVGKGLASVALIRNSPKCKESKQKNAGMGFNKDFLDVSPHNFVFISQVVLLFIVLTTSKLMSSPMDQSYSGAARKTQAYTMLEIFRNVKFYFSLISQLFNPNSYCGIIQILQYAVLWLVPKKNVVWQ